MSFFSQPGWTTGVFLGTKYRYYTHRAPRGNDSRPTILLLHGFPSGPLTFRKMAPLLKAKGYSFIIPELVGYGETDCPTDHKAYGRKKIVDELRALLDRENVRKVLLFGHDHGAPIASTFARLYPERSIALVMATVPYWPANPTGIDIKQVNAQNAAILGYENWGYWELFVRPDVHKFIDAHIESLVAIMWSDDPYQIIRTQFCPTGALETNLRRNFAPRSAHFASPELVAYIKKRGIAGALAWYCAAASPTINYELESTIPERLALPYLFLSTNQDATCPPVLSTRQGDYCDDLTVKEFNTSHWVCEEDPVGVVDAVDGWIRDRRFRSW